MFTHTKRMFAIGAFMLLTAVPAEAQTANVSDMVARMNAIIEEMQTLQTEFASLAASLQGQPTPAPTPQVQGVSTAAVFSKSLVFGETNDDIKNIQTLLATDPEIYDHPHVTGFFGPKTEEAIKNLQTRFGLDPVGVIGPATKALLEGYFRAYPSGNYPDGVLSTKPPSVLGAVASTNGDSATTLTALQSQLSTLRSGSSATGNPADTVSVRFDDGEAWVTIEYNDGTPTMRIVADSEDEDDIVDFVVGRTKLTSAQVLALISYTNEPGSDSSKRSSSKSNEDDAEDALDEADEKLDEARDEINEADEDGDDVDWADKTYDEAKDLYRDSKLAFKDEDWNEAVNLAEEAEELANDAIDRIGKKEGSGSNEVDEIVAYIGDDEALIEVEFEDGDSDDFTVKTDEEEEIIEEVADELDIDEDEVEDLIEFRGKKVDRIEVEIDDDESFAYIEFEDGSDKTYSISETDEDEIIEALAKKLDLTEREVKRVTTFD